MFSIKFITLVVFVIHLFGAKANLEVYFDDVIIDKVSPEYIKDAASFISDDSDNENAVVVNFTLIKTFPSAAQGHLEVIGASMGEYVLPTGMDFEMDLCDMINEPVVIGPFLTGLGFKPDECPPQPGVYGSSGYQLPTDELPEEFPPNKYKVLFHISDAETILCRVIFLIDIQ